MKINEVPEKIYIIPHTLTDGFCHRWFKEPFKIECIEYVHKDTFIEKAAAYLNEKFYFSNLHYAVENNTFNCMEEMFEDFKKYMEEM